MEKKKWQVTKVHHTLIRGGETAGLFNGDLIFIDDFPYLVALWKDYPDGDSMPLKTIRLDPARLHLLHGWGEVTHLYELPLEDPTPYNG